MFLFRQGGQILGEPLESMPDVAVIILEHRVILVNLQKLEGSRQDPGRIFAFCERRINRFADRAKLDEKVILASAGTQGKIAQQALQGKPCILEIMLVVSCQCLVKTILLACLTCPVHEQKAADGGADKNEDQAGAKN